MLQLRGSHSKFQGEKQKIAEKDSTDLPRQLPTPLPAAQLFANDDQRLAANDDSVIPASVHEDDDIVFDFDRAQTRNTRMEVSSTKLSSGSLYLLSQYPNYNPIRTQVQRAVLMHRKFLLIGTHLLILAASPTTANAFLLANTAGSLVRSRTAVRHALKLSAWSSADVSSVLANNVVDQAQPQPPKTKIDSLTSLDTFLDYIDNAPRDSLVAVKFYGKSCPLCKRVALKYKKMAKIYSQAPIAFAEIEKTVHPNLFDTLQVTTFPYLQIYRNGQCIASHGTESAPRFESIVHDTIQQFLRMQANDDWDSFLSAFAGLIQKSTENLQTARDMRARMQEVSS